MNVQQTLYEFSNQQAACKVYRPLFFAIHTHTDLIINVAQRVVFRRHIAACFGIERHGKGFHGLFFAIAVVAHFEYQRIHACGGLGLGIDVKRGFQIGIGFAVFRCPFAVVSRAYPAAGHALFPWA